MSEGSPTWKITPPLDPTGPAYHIWSEDDQAWREAHADWDAPPATLATDERMAAIVASVQALDAIAAQDKRIADAARDALTALEAIVRLWPYPQIDIRAVLDLVRLLQEQASADASSRTE